MYNARVRQEWFSDVVAYTVTITVDQELNMVFVLKMIGWPFPWRDTEDRDKKIHREQMDRYAAMYDGIVLDAEPHTEEFDDLTSNVTWTWRIQADHDPRYPVIGDEVGS
jgi:hypothetical protein